MRPSALSAHVAYLRNQAGNPPGQSRCCRGYSRDEAFSLELSRSLLTETSRKSSGPITQRINRVDRELGNQMYLSELVGGLRRRWWAVVIGLLGTAAITYVAFTLVPPEQQAHASLVILPPAKTVGERGNPYLALGGLQPAADMLAAAMNSGPVHASLAPSHGSATFEVAQDANSSGPMLLVSVSDDDPKRTLALLDSVIETMPHVLAQLQEQVNVRTSNRLTLTEVTRDTQAEPSVKKLVRATLVAAVGGIALTVFGTNMLDGLLMRRSVKKTTPRARSAEETSRVDGSAPIQEVWSTSSTERKARRRTSRSEEIDASTSMAPNGTTAGPMDNAIRTPQSGLQEPSAVLQPAQEHDTLSASDRAT